MMPKVYSEGANMVMVHTEQGEYYFSYATCVAFRSNDGKRIRRMSNYSNTTAKHMSKFGVKEWEKVEDDQFELIAKGA